MKALLARVKLPAGEMDRGDVETTQEVDETVPHERRRVMVSVSCWAVTCGSLVPCCPI